MSRWLGVLVWMLVVLLGPAVMGAERAQLNVLFIAIDDLKPMLGCYGDKVVRTPEIDRLAARGMIFTRAYCQWPVCGPSRASLMTSLRPEASGVIDLKTDMRARNPDVIALPQHFRAHGYTTAGVGKIYDPRCVDSKRDCDRPSWSIPFVTPRVASTDKGGEDGEGKPAFGAPDDQDRDHIDGQITQSGLDLMQRLAKDGKPFFLAVGYKKPHLPFVAPKKYWDLYQRQEIVVGNSSRSILQDSGYVLHDSPEFRSYGGIPQDGDISREIQQEAIHGYLACISFIDAQVGLLIRRLDELGLTKNTVIVLWGDHGFHLGDHGMWGKHSTLEEATRVPLVIVPPQGSAATTSGSPVEFTDIFPTLCQMATIPIPKGLAGRSLLPLVEGTADSVRPGALTVFKNRGSIGYSIRTERYRYTEWINHQNKTVARDLFDYEVDPQETRNLAESTSSREILGILARQLRDVAIGCDRLLASPDPE